ncbi:Pre-mRNA splicing Prp18-interacting factor-domain-containing protein [Chaetomidium leptoderma]|uniref:Pre-mRNA-splicing factor SLU7 n=1 Tax=Chaetomidium leptoderma TaxID=669021 RepID=A0AAN6VD08_9PEZI|nr:Pre-mRNA splicing Prp18-interacting factor-domain-containing protein [Chaetomidium leptoderma]
MPPPPPRRPEPASAATHADSASGAGAARKEDNIYIPSYISKQPFYVSGLDDHDDSLQHQRRTTHDEDEVFTFERGGKKAGAARTKWVKGSCENCGAMGHKKKDCLERPRKLGAKFTGKDIQADRTVRDVNLGYEAKRDVWAAYDTKQYKEVVEEYNLVEEARRALLQEQNGDKKEGEDVYEEGFKYAEESELGKDKTVKQSMRIREDTAKYLLNLDSDSAKYNPKKRALVDAGAIADQSAQLFAEESYLRASGEAAEFEKAQRYAWEAQERTGDTSLHLQANPTAGELQRKREGEGRDAKRRKRAELLASQYGEQPTVPEALKATITESERFVEYDEAGLIKGAPRKAAKSKYAEDVFVNNHTSVWGSWWSDFKWGYACCHSFVKNSYCTGDMGRQAIKEADAWDKRHGENGEDKEDGEDGEDAQHSS